MSACMYVCIYICIYLYTHRDKCVCVYVCVYIYIYIYIHTHTHPPRQVGVCVCIYIYCHPQTDCFVVSQLFSVARHIESWDQNLPNFTLDLVSYHSARKQTMSAQELYIYIYIHIPFKVLLSEEPFLSKRKKKIKFVINFVD